MDETVSSVGTLASGQKKPTKINEFKVLGKLGEGSFSTVYKVQRNADGKVYAMKKVRMSRLTEREKSNALNEIRILASAKSDHIVEYRDSFFDGSSDSLCIVMEYAQEGDLLQKLNEIKIQNKINKEAKELLLKTPSEKEIIPNVEEEDSVLSIGYVESNVKMETKNEENSQKRSVNKYENNNNNTILSRQLITTNKCDSPLKGQLVDNSNYSANKQNSKINKNSILKSFSKTNSFEPNQNNTKHEVRTSNSENYIFMPEEQVWDYLVQCTKGLQCLHSMGIVHRDLKCANVLISQHNIVKIGDLNVSVVTRKASHLGKTHPGGTPFYTAPEVWQGHACDFKSDIWSLGCVAYELCAQIPPFQGTTLAGLCANILNGSFQRIPKVYSDELSTVINLCLTYQPRDRPSSQDLLQLPIIQPYIKAYEERYSQYLKNTTTVYNGELEHLSPERRAKKNLLEQPHLIDTISLPSNLKRLSPLLPRAHYEDTLPLPTVAEFKVAGQNQENLGKSGDTTDFEGGKELSFSSTKKDLRNSSPSENYHDLVNHSPIRFTLKKVRMDESKYEEGSAICNNPERKENEEIKNEQKKSEEQVLEVIQRDSQIFSSEIATINVHTNQKETKIKEETNSSRIQMLSAYLEKLRSKVQKQPQVSQFGIASSYREFENVFEFRQQPQQQRHIRTLSRDSSSNEERGHNCNKRQDNRFRFSIVQKKQIKNNRAQFIQQEQQSQIASDLVNYHIQNILNNNYQLNQSNIPANSSNLSAVSHISNNIQRHLGQPNTSFINNNPSSGSNHNKSSANFQKTLTTNDSISNFSPPITSLRRTRRFISQHSNKNHNNSQNSKEDLMKKPKSSSPQQPMSTQFSQVVKCYLPRTSAHQHRNSSSERQQTISVITTQRQISPPIVSKRAALSAKITSSKVAKYQQPCHSFHVKQMDIPVQDQILSHLRNDDNKENILVSPNYPTVFSHRGLSSRINRQFKQPCENSQNNQDTSSKVLKLAQVCKKHKTNQEKSIFHDHTREIFEDRTGQCQQYLPCYMERNHNERTIKIQSAQRQLGFQQQNKKLAFYQASQMYNPKERKQNVFPILR